MQQHTNTHSEPGLNSLGFIYGKLSVFELQFKVRRETEKQGKKVIGQENSKNVYFVIILLWDNTKESRVQWKSDDGGEGPEGKQ